MNAEDGAHGENATDAPDGGNVRGGRSGHDGRPSDRDGQGHG
ncbi:hypothetical protein ACIPX0_21595 [Streptomyces sp. NPDC090075]